LALLGRLPSAHVDGHVMQASEKPAQFLTWRGVLPLGYQAQNRILGIFESEAKITA
jgi:hypothetical protein